jgi:hypothetical protein
VGRSLGHFRYSSCGPTCVRSEVERARLTAETLPPDPGNGSFASTCSVRDFEPGQGGSSSVLMTLAKWLRRQQNDLERSAKEGESPVCEIERSPLTCALQISARLVESSVKRPGPPGKAKYSSMTDSEPVGRLNGEKHSYELSQKYLKPHTYKRSESYAPGASQGNG